MSNTRAIATQIIHAVCYDGVSLSEAFELEKLPDQDRGFIKEMCFGSIRFWIQLQAILKTLLEKPLKKDDKDIECLICIGLYQILFMHVPNYAVVNETVTATRILKKAWASKLVNKILRMAIQQKDENKIEIRGITAQYAHPNWIIEKIQQAYPDQWETILIANNQKAPLFLRVNLQKTTLAAFEKHLSFEKIESSRVVGLPCALLLPNALPVEKIPGFFEGLFSVQDASGQKVVAYLDLQPDQTILDACAAPGSKTTHILETCPDIKKLISVDISKSRLQKIADNVARLQLKKQPLKLMVADVCEIHNTFANETFDRILLDAPCSATGVIRRHPDIKLLRKKTDLVNLIHTQINMLTVLWPLLKKGGKLIYTTCSIFPDENNGVIQKFISQHPDSTLMFSEQNITGDQNRDGFYYAVLSKNPVDNSGIIRS
ncbi:MAG: 16S rRNA (cytosine(967)-C(5))-methyltransferase RsmB [Gammaproteobacteria bacterium CG_4_10_14_0_8_um_filter_38_16]|nr:MAG: 16S rRNA (cytosine(967)-C(5))-methyltransferase RsmB [Gammaproteobacteria bacterium CG_4_10_14_0_8_um_filter_38_16]PJA03255.1 MAG: 16S rRNA (cytosine(967)-C(5))-methyltransferase RsmB [Gammaproteobacteria bacterium CG_4_10_14_0_2_um_filter_38_22]PJB09843.1 MAG: 16S rRNA (cytosine(967)-C(5))-methyltransferase RsmB [Gammaproteobacteria bacterium CG_4_9_14_3_um_filter_38_9]